MAVEAAPTPGHAEALRFCAVDVETVLKASKLY